MHEVGFEPTRCEAPGLKSGSLDHSDIRACDSLMTYLGRCSSAGSNRRPSAHKTDALTNWATRTYPLHMIIHAILFIWFQIIYYLILLYNAPQDTRTED